MKKWILTLSVLAVAASASAQTLTILHLNDTHSHIDPERATSLYGRGGVLERAAYIDSVRLADGKDNVLLLHAGDFSQGSSYFTKLGGEIEVDFLNDLGYDVVTIGNHEFDNGIDALAGRLKRVKAPVVCADYDFSGTPIGKYVKKYAIVKKAGMKIGIIGLTTDVRPVVDAAIARQLKYIDPAEVTNSLALMLKTKKKCDMVICLTHLGFDGSPDEFTDKVLVSRTRNVDLVVGGHSHTYLEEVFYQENLDGVPVPIVQNWCWGMNMANLKLEKE
ncbi:MAG: bifunctional metallophosphatase/5'-nucleotidase [Candidatus Cryptobacteroides sp.]